MSDRPERMVRVRCTWETVHEIEVPEGTPRMKPDDLDAVLAIEDVSSDTASLIDWEVTDCG